MKDAFGREIKVGDFLFGSGRGKGTGGLYKVAKLFPHGFRSTGNLGIHHHPYGYIIVDPDTIPEEIKSRYDSHITHLVHAIMNP